MSDWSPPDSDTKIDSWKPPETDRDNPYDPNRPAIGDSVGNLVEQVGSGLYHGVVGGYKGLATLAKTHNMDKATEAVNDETSKAYQAPDSTLKSAVESKYNPLNWIQNGADYLADKSADYGASPGLSTAIKSAPMALAAATGTVGLMRKPFAAVRDAYRGSQPAKTFTPEEAVSQTAAQQSTGAAATVPDISDVPPEFKSALSEAANKTGGQLHPIALDRHLDTLKLPLPEGSEPLWLRRGQATADDQQLSDEKNLRSDPDTQGYLTDSIKDQDEKLVASMGEIRRRATPEIVQRNNSEHDQAAINAIKEQQNAAMRDMKAKYQALADQNGGSVPINTGATIEAIASRLKRDFSTADAQKSGVVSSVMQQLFSGQPMSFEEFENARTRLAARQRAGGDDAHAAAIVRNALEEMPLSPSAAHLKSFADDARAAAKNIFDTADANPAYAAVMDDNVKRLPGGFHDTSQPSPLAGKFLDTYATGNGPNATPAFIQRLKATVPDPILSQSIEAATLNKLRDAAGIDATGNGSFRNAQYKNALRGISDKSNVLLSPETVDNLERLKRVSGYVNDEGKASSVNKSGTALALIRHGAQFPTDPTLKEHLLDVGTDIAAGHVGAPAVLGKKLLQSKVKKNQEEAMKQSVRDAKLNFAIDATKPGAGLDAVDAATANRPNRASGGKVSTDELVERLVKRWKAAKKATDQTTKPLLNVPDAVIVKALDIAGRAI